MNKSETTGLPNFIPIFLGIRDHLKEGVSPADFGTYSALHLICDWKTGVLEGTAQEVAALFGGQTYINQVQASMLRLRDKFGLINYAYGEGKRGTYPILIDKYIVRTGPLRGFRLNAFASGSPEELVYEMPDGAQTGYGRSSDGGQTVARRNPDGTWTQPRPIQEYKESFKKIRIYKKVKRSTIQSDRLNAEPILSCDDLPQGEEGPPAQPARLVMEPTLSNDAEAGDDADRSYEVDEAVLPEGTPAEALRCTAGMGTNEDIMRTMKPATAAIELAGLLLNRTGHEHVTKADLYGAGKAIFPLVKKQGYAEIARVINWATGQNEFWTGALTKANAPAASFVKNYHKILNRAAVELSAAQVAEKRKNPNYDPDVDTPGTAKYELARAFN